MSDRGDDPMPNRLVSERATSELATALVSAYAPGDLDPRANERLIREALEDPLRPASDDELRESERLRRALDGESDHPDLDLARSLASAHRAERSSPPATRELVERAARGALGKPPSKQHGSVIYVTFGGVLAAAATVALLVGDPRDAQHSHDLEGTPASMAAPSLQRSRSSEELFSHKFSRGHTSERIDRIASARSRDLRANRFRQWGVR
jgi:hypothetical protein